MIPPSGRVLVVGDVMTDIIVAPHGPMVRGSDRAATIRSHPGGSGANQAVWLAASGVPTRFAARVGAGDRERLTAEFTTQGVEAVLAGDPELPSGVLVTVLDADGERSFLTDRGANAALSAADLPDSLFAGVSALVVSGYSLFAAGPRAAVLDLLARAKARDVLVAVDAASTGFLREVGPENFLRWVAGSDLLFANSEEAALLSGCAAPVEQLAALGQTFREVVVKRGALGAMHRAEGGAVFEAAARSVPVVDTTGAGDAFAAAFLAARLGGAQQQACLAAAVAAGSRAVQFLGGRPQRV